MDWEEFKGMFYRIRDDQTGYEPRKLFNVVEFIMHDKNFTGSIDLDEAVTILYARFGKVCRRASRCPLAAARRASLMRPMCPLRACPYRSPSSRP